MTATPSKKWKNETFPEFFKDDFTDKLRNALISQTEFGGPLPEEAAGIITQNMSTFFTRPNVSPIASTQSLTNSPSKTWEEDEDHKKKL